ncbi:MAG: Gldg family protein [Planctomycetota bacterium]
MIGKRLGLWSGLLLGGVLALAVWVLVVWVASRPALKTLIDLTPQRINSVDPATEELLRELRAQKAEIEFYLFYPPMDGQAADPMRQQEARIRGQLREMTRLLLVRYQFLGGESVKVIALDLYGDPQTTREAAQKFDYRDSETDVLVVAVRMPGKPLRHKKLSLPLDLGRIEQPNAGQTGLSQSALPVLKQFVGEEQISSAMKSLLVEGTPVAYLLPGCSPDLQVGDIGAGYGPFLAALGLAGFEVRRWDAAAQPAVPKDAAVVIVLEPRREFPDALADSLFAYLQRGGRLFVNYSWAQLPDWNPDGGRLGELLGYELSAQPVFHLIADVGNRTGGRGLDGDPAVAKLQLRINSAHPTTTRFARSGRPMEVAAARELRERAGAPTAIVRTELLRTGDQGWLALPGPDGYPSFRAPQVRLRDFLVGMVCEVPPAAAAADGSGDPVRPGQAVLVSGLFCNAMAMPQFGDLALNICNWLAERRVLLDLKTPGYEAKQLNLQPQQMNRIGNLLVFGVPGLFLVLGAVVFLVRRRQ